MKPPRKAVVLTFVVLVCFFFANDRAQAQTLSLATVDVTVPGEYRPFVQGADAIFGMNGQNEWWSSIPTDLGDGSLNFYYVGEDPSKTSGDQYGMMHFTVMTSGPVWMLTTSRYGDGGSGTAGTGWMAELTTPEQLQLQGWVKLRSDVYDEWEKPGMTTPGTVQFDLWQRYSNAGENFSIRTEKYNPPVIMQNAIPEPSTWSLLTLGAVTLLGGCRMRRRS